jgi:hypothetical protein
MRALLIVLAVLALPRTAAAHDVRGEVLFLDVSEHSIGVEIQVPQRQLELARRGNADDLRAYVARYVGATTRDGEPFTPTVGDIGTKWVGDGDVVDIHVDLEAPAGASARWFRLRDDLVLQRVQTDTVYIFLRSDVQDAVTGAPKLVGYLHYQQRTFDIDRPVQTSGGKRLLFALALLAGLAGGVWLVRKV